MNISRYRKKAEGKRGAEIQETRVSYKMDRLENKKRNCLRCSKEFVSEGFHNRMCFNCRSVV
jgi:hypothetical protein